MFENSWCTQRCPSFQRVLVVSNTVGVSTCFLFLSTVPAKQTKAVQTKVSPGIAMLPLTWAVLGLMRFCSELWSAPLLQSVGKGASHKGPSQPPQVWGQFWKPALYHLIIASHTSYDSSREQSWNLENFKSHFYFLVCCDFRSSKNTMPTGTMPLQGYVVSLEYFCKRTERFDEFSVFVLAQILQKDLVTKVKEKESAGAL